MLAAAGTASCKPIKKSQPESSVQGLFTERQRIDESTQPSLYPIMALAEGCTGFVLETRPFSLTDQTTVGTAVTAAHCKIEAGSKLCLNASNGQQAEDLKTCEGTMSARIDDQPVIRTFHKGTVTDVSNYLLQDFTLFRFSLEKPLRDNYPHYFRLGRHNYVNSIFNDSRPGPGTMLNLIGYPADKEARERRMRSFCHVRSPLLPISSGNSERFFKIHRALNAFRDREPQAYRAADEACDLDSLRALGISFGFFYDCSTYGGNSGGPIYFLDKRRVPVVIGISHSSMQNPEDFAQCEVFWTSHVRKYLVAAGVEKVPERRFQGMENWDRLSRDSSVTPITDYALASPMYYVVKYGTELAEELRPFLYDAPYDP